MVVEIVEVVEVEEATAVEAVTAVTSDTGREVCVSGDAPASDDDSRGGLLGGVAGVDVSVVASMACRGGRCGTRARQREQEREEKGRIEVARAERVRIWLERGGAEG